MEQRWSLEDVDITRAVLLDTESVAEAARIIEDALGTRLPKTSASSMDKEEAGVVEILEKFLKLGPYVKLASDKLKERVGDVVEGNA